MINFRYVFLIVTIFVNFYPDMVFSSDRQTLIAEINVFDNDTTFQYSYLYDTSGNVAVQTKYYILNDIKYRLTQTEWVEESNGNKVQWEKHWNGSNWEAVYKIESNYLNGRLNGEVHTIFNNGAPTLLKKTDYVFSDTLVINRKEYQWKQDNWVLSLQTDYKYLSDGKTDTVTTTAFLADNSISRYKSVYSYNQNGLLSEELVQQNLNDSDWINYKITNWYYKPGTQLIKCQRVKFWNKNFSSWENSENIENTYNAENELETETFQNWKIMFWNDDLRYQYIYDTKGVMLSKILLKPIYHQWRKMLSINYSDFNNDKANLIESEFEFWGGNTGELTTSFIPFDFNNSIVIQKGEKIEISYSSTNNNTGFPAIYTSGDYIQVYPNPSKGIFYIDTDKYLIKSWTIINTNGQVVQSKAQGNQSGVIDLTDLPNGIYLIKVKTENSQFMQKLIKQY